MYLNKRIHDLLNINCCFFYPEPDVGMEVWEAQKYMKQLVAGVVSL